MSIPENFTTPPPPDDKPNCGHTWGEYYDHGGCAWCEENEHARLRAEVERLKAVVRRTTEAEVTKAAEVERLTRERDEFQVMAAAANTALKLCQEQRDEARMERAAFLEDLQEAAAIRNDLARERDEAVKDADFYEERMNEEVQDKVKAEGQRDRLAAALEWILNRHKMDNPPWRCACDICEACRKGLGIE